MENLNSNKRELKDLLQKTLPFSFFIFSLILYAYYANLLRSGPNFDDETANLVGAIMIADGMNIYRDVFAHQAPFTYMIAHLFYWISGGSGNIAIYRFIPLLFSILSMISIGFSPAIKKANLRLLAASIFALGLTAMQAIYGFVLGTYQVYSGNLLVCALALLIIPVIVDNKISRFFAFTSGLCLGFTFFCGYSFAPTCALLMLIVMIKPCTGVGDHNLNKLTFYYALFGALTSVVTVGIYLYIYGDIIGYAIYHFYFNQFIYAKFLSFLDYDALRILYFLFPGSGYLFFPTYPWLCHVILSSVSIFAALLLISLRGKIKYSKKIFFTYFALLLLGIIFSNIRSSSEFHMATLVIVAIGFGSLVLSIVLSNSSTWKSPLSKITIAIIAIFGVSFIIAQYNTKTSLYSLSVSKYYKISQRDKSYAHRSKASDFELLRTIVAPDEPVQQFSYNIWFYLKLDRKPASGNYYYLPWQHQYFQDPILGYRIDICKDMEHKLPKIIYYGEEVIWYIHPRTYIGCVEKLLQDKYLQTTIMQNVWIRADIAASRDDLLKTVIVPENNDYSWLEDKLQERLLKAKIIFRTLSVSDKDICLHKPSVSHTTIVSGSCFDENALEVGIRSDDNFSEIVSLHDQECMEVEGAVVDEKKPLRLWPCQSSVNQSFSVIPDGDGFRLRSDNSKLCLTLNDGLLVQDKCAESTKWQWKAAKNKVNSLAN